MKYMENRKRNNRLRFNLTDEEKELFERKKKQSGAKNMNHFIRKTVLEKEIYHVDLSPFYDLQTDVKVLTDYTNQVAKSVNTIGILRKYEMDGMKERLAVISEKITAIHDLLRRR